MQAQDKYHYILAEESSHMYRVWNQQHSHHTKWTILLVSLLIIGAIVGVFLLPRFISLGTIHTTVQPPQMAMFGIDAQHTHANPVEHILTPRTVSHLTVDWTSFPTGGSLFSSPVIADGIVYINSLDSRLYAYNATGCSRSACAPRWFSAPTGDRIYSTPAVANGVVYVS